MKLNRPLTSALVLLTASLAGAAPDFSPTSGKDRPHIILVMADDQGWGDTGYNGHPFVQTPTLDAMAKEGFVFNRFYAAAPVCSPTRASVLTGRNPNRSKVTQHGRYIRGHKEKPLPRALRTAGYVTGMFGKWHVGSAQPDSPVNPGGLGFDEWVIGLNFFDTSPYLSRNGVVEHREGEKGSVVVIDETIDFLDKHKDGGKPMFAVAWFPSPHDPHAEVSSRPELYEGKKGRGYFQEITLLDEQLGRLRKWLRDAGIADDTLLWYCSDNGGLMRESSGGRGKKGDTWEGGLRVPGIIEWPGRKLSGSTNVPVVTSDIYPTLLALTGIEDADPLPLDGVDVRGVIEGREQERPGIGFWLGIQGGQGTWSDRILKEVMEKQQAGGPKPAIPARMKKDIDEFPQFEEDFSEGNAAWLEWPWKVHRRNAKEYLLFNLEDDPMEAKNLAADPAHQERFEKLKGTMHAWQKSVIGSLNGDDYKAAAERPNVIFIMSDDHSYQAMGSYGSRFAKLDPTPNLDRFARSGVVFDQVFCSNSICTPSRASVMTGQYSHRNGVRDLYDTMPGDRRDLSREMQLTRSCP